MSYKVQTVTYAPVYRGDEGLVLHFPVTAAQTFLKGDVVFLTSKKVSVATTNTVGPSLGVALQDAQTVATPGTAAVTRNIVSVQVFRPTDLYVAMYVSGATFALTDITVAHEIKKTASGNWQVDSATTNNALTIAGSAEYTVDVAGAGPIGNFSSGGALYIKFLAAYCQWTTTAFA